MKSKNFNFRIAAAVLLFFLLAFCVIAFPKASALGASNGLKICSSVLIPALFPFTVAGIFLQKSRVASAFEGIFGWFSKKFFKLDGRCFTVIIISLLGGYPVGAKIIDSMFKNGEIEIKTAKRMLSFCINAGPTFYISIIGAKLMGSEKAGIIIMISNIICCFIMALVTGIFHKKADTVNLKFDNSLSYKNTGNLCDCFIESVSDASEVIIGICAFVIIFSSYFSVADSIISDKSVSAFIACMFEVTTGCIKLQSVSAPIIIYPFVTAFGGLSIIFQVLFSSSHIKPGFIYLLLTSSLRGIISGSFSFFALKLYDIPLICSVASSEINFCPYIDIKSVFLIFFLIIFIIYTFQSQNKLKKNTSALEKTN